MFTFDKSLSFDLTGLGSMPPPLTSLKHLILSVGLEVSVSRVGRKGLLELALLNGVELRAREVDDEQLQAAGERADSSIEKSVAIIEERLEKVRRLLGEDLVLETGEHLRVEKSLGVVDATSQIANVDTSKAVGGASVATKVEELRVLYRHADYILEEERDSWRDVSQKRQ